MQNISREALHLLKQLAHDAHVINSTITPADKRITHLNRELLNELEDHRVVETFFDDGDEWIEIMDSGLVLSGRYTEQQLQLA
jgi:hypothetical protein